MKQDLTLTQSRTEHRHGLRPATADGPRKRRGKMRTTADLQGSDQAVEARRENDDPERKRRGKRWIVAARRRRATLCLLAQAEFLPWANGAPPASRAHRRSKESPNLPRAGRRSFPRPV
ncbi:hypothetical protein QYE76_049434 [Lolium multiflorum]|uniref:Uncharacterized protein n=1 Tax=Lolium multiflorum TaxID=4521 RepID=A0AAD8SP59_LOLMU|nr:hypothetical protein QYE76_049434 [Lolium multiflorum]